MKKTLLAVGVMAVLSMAGRSEALLIDRGNGLIYDNVLNITWLQDANYAQTSGFDADGLMTWDDANTWAGNLIYQGYDNWRLPYASVTAGVGPITTLTSGIPCDGSGGADETACRDNEMAYNFYYNLGGTPGSDLTGTQGPFTNIQSVYWSGTEFNTSSAWDFDFGDGDQFKVLKDVHNFGWAVRPGDSVGVPEPGSALLLGLGLLGLRIVRRWRGRLFE